MKFEITLLYVIRDDDIDLIDNEHQYFINEVIEAKNAVECLASYFLKQLKIKEDDHVIKIRISINEIIV